MIPGFIETLDKMKEIAIAKNADYAGENNDPFKNFKMCENHGITTVEKGILVRMTDKMSRIATLLDNNNEAKVKDEKLTDTLIDLANYSIILKCYIEQKNKKDVNKIIQEEFGGSVRDYLLSLGEFKDDD